MNQSVHHPRLPALFIGHGSPMNALETNPFTRMLGRLGETLPRPKAILCVSAHWLSAGTWITQMASPRTIHDFYGFPKELFEIRYPAPGCPDLAERIRTMIRHPDIHLDKNSWGLDHGTWSVLRWLYPDAEIPVLQLSIDMSEPPNYHHELGKKLRILRDQGVLIMGSGNIVHNLRQIRWEKDASPFDWATEFDEWVRDRILRGDSAALMDEVAASAAARLSVPTLDHYLPLLYVLGAATETDIPHFEYEGIELGSISMRCLKMG